MSHSIAVITDVHGNYPALKAVLDYIDNFEDVEHIYCLGDMIALGPNTNEVLSELFGRSDISMILGNHEDAVLQILNGKKTDEDEEAYLHHKWVGQGMDENFAERLKNLPRWLTVRHYGRTFRFVHYHLDRKEQFIPVDGNPTSDKLDALYTGEDIQLVGFGHHHPIHLLYSPNRIYLNPGALGCSREPEARYGIVEITADALKVRLGQVPYDNTEFLKLYEKLQVPARDLILRMFHSERAL